MDFSWLTEHMPFAVAAGVTGPKISGMKIFEASIIAFTTAIATSMVTVAKIETKAELRDAYYQQQFDKQVSRRDGEMAAVKTSAREDQIRQQAQYELIRTELQRLALAMERQNGPYATTRESRR